MSVPRRRVGLVLGVLAVLVLSGAFGGALFAGRLSAVSAAPTGLHLASAPHGGATAASGGVPLGPVSTGTGSFYTDTALPLPKETLGAGNQTRDCLVSTVPGKLCPVADTLNVSADVAANYTSSGVLAVAYTSMTNTSACPADANYTQSEITFESSSNQGASWAAPQTIGPSSCTIASTYPNAWEPALTSLSNGTLVLVYVLYNSSYLVPFLNPYVPPLSELVMSESYTNGATWTAPTVLNSSVDPSLVGISFPQLQPTVTAIGQSIYVSWMTMAEPANPPNPGAPSSVSILISTDGGLGWSPVISVASSPYENYGNPNLLVNNTGAVFLAYAAGIPYSGIVEVAVSTDNFTSWTTHFVAFSSSLPLPGPFSLVEPKLAWNTAHQELYVAYSGNDYFTCVPPYTFCGDLPVAEVYNTTDGGLLWNHELSAKTAFYNPATVTRYTANRYYNPSPYQVTGVYDVGVAVTASNNLELTGLVVNESRCFGFRCGFLEQEAVNSSNGVTWGGPYLLNGTLAWNATGWPGESSAVLSSGANLWYAYTQLTCPSGTSVTGNCNYYPYSPLAQSQVHVSTPFSGAGFTATFTASGLNATTAWEVDLNGNIRIGNGTSSLVVSGIPSGAVVSWVLPAANNTTEFRFYATAQTIYPAVEVTSSFTDIVNYTEYVPFIVKVSPPAYGNPNLQPPNPIGYGGCVTDFYNGGTVVISYFNCVNLRITPYAINAINWVPVAQPLQVNISSENLLGPLCYNFISTASLELICSVGITNLSFLSWTGVGLGSVTSSQPNITVLPMGAVTETANVYATSGCSGYYEKISGHVYSTPSCGNITTTLQFNEHGLPSGTNWGVGLTAAGGFDQSQQSTTGAITFQNLAVATYYTINAWTIPTSNPNMFWVGNVSVGAGIVPPTGLPVKVNFTLESLAGLSLPLLVQENGLPTGSTWSYTVDNGIDNSTYGAYGSSSTITLPAATDYSVSAGFVSGEAGAGYEVTGVTYFVDTVNGSAVINTSLTAAFNLTGATNITFWYGLAYYVSMVAGANGTVSPGSSWVLNATGFLIHATPDPGYIFVGWSGSGSGATGSAQRHTAVTLIHPTGPVTEIATFAPRPPPTWTLSVSENGLPLAQPYTVELGGTAYTGNGSFGITNLSTMTVNLGFPYVYDTGNPGLRYTGGVSQSSLNLTGVTLQIDANGTLVLSYSTQYLLTVTGTTGGTVTPAGASWENAGTQVPLTASANPGYRFSGWNGTGIGSKTTVASQVTVVVGGVMTETALFSAIPRPPPATYTLTVNETGLPAATSWNAGLGTAGASGTAGIVFANLNGTYMLSVPVVYGASGVRYVPNGTVNYTQSLGITSGNSTWSVTFQKQVLLTLEVSGSGSITQGSSGWVSANTPVSLTAAAATGWLFAGWSGTGAGSSSANGTSTTVTPTGPVVETATFTPMNPAPTTSGSSSSGMPLALGLLVGLLVAGLLVGMLLARRRRRSPPPPEPMESWQEAPTDSESPPVDSGVAPPGSS